jgi:hypothetical protein
MTETREQPAQSDENLHISELLQRFLEQHQQDRICLRDLLNELGDRAFGPTLLLCALPEALPLPVAGVSAFIGIPLLLVSTQLTLGFRHPWLPRQILERPFKRKHFEKLTYHAIRYLRKIERVLKPRWQLFTHPAFERCIGLLLMILAVVISLPIPFGNMLPAMAIVFICLGMVEKDGLVLAISSLAGCVILALAIAAILTFLPVPSFLQPQK